MRGGWGFGDATVKTPWPTDPPGAENVASVIANIPAN